MGYFRYKLIDTTGRIKGGFIQLPFDNPLSAMAFLERRGVVVLYANQLPPWLGAIMEGFVRFTEKPIQIPDIVEVLNNIAIMLRAGIPLLSALRDTMVESNHATLTKVGEDIMRRIQAGLNLSEAAGYHKRYFPDTSLFLMRIGEETGCLDRTLKSASQHIQKIHRILSQTKRALIYPAFMFTVIFGAIAFWLWFVVPVMVDLFKDMNMKLPPLTIAVLALSDVIQHYGLWILGGIVAVIGALSTLIQKHRPTRWGYHQFLLHLPVVGEILHCSNLAFITEYFSLLLSAGVDVPKSLEILQQSLKNEVYKEKMVQVREHLIRGNTLRESFREAKIFPPFVVRMIGVGEQSGTLPEQLTFAADEYQVRLNALVENIGKSIEPIALLVGGGLFLVMLIALFLPVYSLVGGIGRR